jgi:transposase-like protein
VEITKPLLRKGEHIMPFKTKIETDEKIAVVEAYLQGELGRAEALKRCGICDKTFQLWVMRFKTQGREGLEVCQRARNYDPALKVKVVQEYLSGEESLFGLCREYAISSPSCVREWIKRYNGHEEFKQPRNRGEIRMTKGRTTTQEERIEIVTYCIEQGKDYGAAIERYHVSYQQIYSWVRKYEASGVSGLSDKRGKRKQPEEMTDLERLRAENRLLQAENKRKELEIALLKKLREVERRRG